MLTLVLTRHGLTNRSLPEQHLGQRIDEPLNDDGRRQARALRDRLRSVPFARVIASPLIRAHETATLLAGDIPVEVDARLEEMDYGEWEGRTYAELEANWGEERRRWAASPDVLACPGGESGYDVAERVGAFLVDLLRDHASRVAGAARSDFGGRERPQPGDPTVGGTDAGADERPVLAVGHSSTNRILVCVALGLPIREYRQRLIQGQANVTVLRFEHGDGPADARLLLLNDLAHLRPRNAAPWE